ncbi:MAG: YecA family protein [Wenzhouxiangella sp.]|nr:MAG: YecA family protein [Wenzhouxiangella sp.]
MFISPETSFSEADRQNLIEFLDCPSHPGLGYAESAGFLFALVCAPNILMPSDWLSAVLGDREFSNQTEAEKVLGSLMGLNNWIVEQIDDDQLPLPPEVGIAEEPMANFEPLAPMRRWAEGFLVGHGWVSEDWESLLPEDQLPEGQELSLALAALGFFSSRDWARRICTEMFTNPPEVEQFAESICRMLPEAFVIYARAGRSLRQPHAGPDGPEFSSAELDFQGLSPDQMHALLYHPFQAPDVVHFRTRLEVEPQAPVLTLLQLLLEGIGEKGLKATAKGNLPRQFCRQVAMQTRQSSGFPAWLEPERLHTETDYQDLHITRLLAELTGLIRKYKGRFVLIRKTQKLLERSGLREIYPMLLETAAIRFNWAYRDGFPDLRIIQQSFAFSLYLLSRHGHEQRPSEFYETAFIKAFPAALAEVEETEYRSAESQVRTCYRWRALRNFFEFMGLLESDEADGDTLAKEYLVRSRPLLAQSVVFTLDTGQARQASIH